MISPSSSPSGKCYQKRPVTAPGVLAAIKDMMPPLCIKISITGLFRKSVSTPFYFVSAVIEVFALIDLRPLETKNITLTESCIDGKKADFLRPALICL
jgi:hypothetical protein